ncbi:MAG: sugar phosphate isomerase/epimerase [Eubacteriales bacterium]|nr:sugar phosphate isomerase/epimerase [Eubacteriales bacterium]
MNIGIRLHDTAPGTLQQRAAVASAQGFTCAHVALYKHFDPAPEASTFSPILARTLKNAIRPLSIAILGCYLNLAHPDERVYRETLGQYLAHLRLAAWIGGCAVGTETGNPNAAYRFDPQTSHSEEALSQFIRRLRPVVEEAEKLQTTIALEPVYTHIVHDPQTARRVLDAFASPSLKIILDPVNLLHPANIARRDEIVAEALALLGPSIAPIHLKDYVCIGDTLRTLPSGQGEMDDVPVLRFVMRTMPDVPLLLENTTPENAAGVRAHIERLLTACEPRPQ